MKLQLIFAGELSIQTDRERMHWNAFSEWKIPWLKFIPIMFGGPFSETEHVLTFKFSRSLSPSSFCRQCQCVCSRHEKYSSF